jgi:hypothetical protein
MSNARASGVRTLTTVVGVEGTDVSYDMDCYCDDLEDDDGDVCVFCEMALGWALDRLGKNLAIAGALCQAYLNGWKDAMDKAHWGPGWD